MARLVLAGVWIVAGVLKLPDPAASVRACACLRPAARDHRPHRGAAVEDLGFEGWQRIQEVAQAVLGAAQG